MGSTRARGPIRRDGETAPKCQRSRPHWRKRLAIATVVLFMTTVLGITHARLLQALASLLVVDQQPAQEQYLWYIGAEKDEQGVSYDQAVELYRTDPSRRILSILPKRTFSERVGIVPTGNAVLHHELGKRGVPNEAFVVIGTDVQNTWEAARSLEKWLIDHPQARIVVLCGRFSGCCLSYILGSVLGDGEMKRVKLLGLRNAVCNETNWWRTARGWKELYAAYVSLVYVRLQGEAQAKQKRFDPEEYETTLRQMQRGRP